MYCKFFTLCFVCVAFGMSAQLKVSDRTQLQYEWLSEEPSSKDAVFCFHEIAAEMEIRAVLQIGLGYSTQYFLEKAKKVVSLEFITPGKGPNGFREFMSLYQDVMDWMPVIYFSGYNGDKQWIPFKYIGSESLYKANTHQSTTGGDYATVDPGYIRELGGFFRNLIKTKSFDVVCIEPEGIYVRGDLVQLCFGRIPIILAGHAVSRYAADLDIYGYQRVHKPIDYVEILLPTGMVAWILNDKKYDSLIERLQKVSHEVAL